MAKHICLVFFYIRLLTCFWQITLIYLDKSQNTSSKGPNKMTSWASRINAYVDESSVYCLICLWIKNTGIKWQDENWLFAQPPPPLQTLSHSPQTEPRAKERVRASETDTVCGEVAPGHSVNLHQGLKDRLRQTRTQRLRKRTSREPLHWGELMKMEIWWEWENKGLFWNDTS